MSTIQPFTLPDFRKLVVKKKSHEVITREGYTVEVLKTRLRNQIYPILTVIDFLTTHEVVRYAKSKLGIHCWCHVPQLDLFLRLIGSTELPEQITGKRPDSHWVSRD